MRRYTFNPKKSPYFSTVIKKATQKTKKQAINFQTITFKSEIFFWILVSNTGDEIRIDKHLGTQLLETKRIGDVLLDNGTTKFLLEAAIGKKIKLELDEIVKWKKNINSIYNVNITLDNFLHTKDSLSKYIKLRYPPVASIYYQAIVSSIKKKYKTLLSKLNTRELYENLMLINLQEAGNSFVFQLPEAGIFFCRATLEMALRNKIITTLKKQNKNFSHERECDFLNKLMLGQLLTYANGEKVNKHTIPKMLDKAKIETIFKRRFNHDEQNSFWILHKFVHGDILPIITYLQEKQNFKLDDNNLPIALSPFKASFAAILFPKVLDTVYSVIEYLYK